MTLIYISIRNVVDRIFIYIYNRYILNGYIVNRL